MSYKPPTKAISNPNWLIDYPAEGFVYDKEHCRYRKLYSQEWISDKEMANPYSIKHSQKMEKGE